ncbi:MAG: 8-amino-7-oxononanoate synthase, partial [Candidatus Dormibacteraeota bacterium]|nr:8-amino-7-oxononanoate synthase [Candidatus Dormibacteraeota bacterium]
MLDQVRRRTAASQVRWADAAIERDRAAELLRTPRVRSGGNGIHGRIDGRSVVEFSSNDYLGLSVHPRVREAAARAARELGVGATGSRHLSGSHAAMLELESTLAGFEGTETATLAPTGYAANVAILEALGGPDAIVFSDALNHASMIDGCRASRSRVEVYGHRNTADLERRLATCEARAIIVSDGVFSSEGSVADVAALAELAERYDAWLVVDEAHATGVVGPDGAGVVAAAGVSARPNVVKVVTFSKALGASGGAVCGTAQVRQLLLQRGRSLIYSTGLAHPVVAAVSAALGVLEDEPELRARLRFNATLLHQLMDRLSSPDHACELPLLLIPAGGAGHAMELEQALWRGGWMVHALRPPTVPQGRSALRVIVSALHQPE